MSSHSPLALIGAPIDLGASRRGAGLGPAALRIAGLAPALAGLGHSVVDHGDVRPDEMDAGTADVGLHAPAVASLCRALYDRVSSSLEAGELPITLGGDHSLAMGSVAAAARHAHLRGRGFALLWLDAHADYNNPDSSPSHNLHGMPVSMLTGDPRFVDFLGARPFAPIARSDVRMFGLRSIDREERAALAADGLACFDMRLIDEFGVSALMRDLLATIDPATTHLHLSFDLDVIDPAIAPGTGTTVEGGLTWREAHLVMEMLHEHGAVASCDVVELNPMLDERGRTASLAVDLLGSLFGKRITGAGRRTAD